MPVINRIAGFADDMVAWRRWMHRHPELGFDCRETAAFLAARLDEFGVDEIHEGIAETGIVAIVNGRGAGRTIGLRADMDALPIVEETGLDWASEAPGRMHACGHDGHAAMLLGAARYLAETRNFRGRVALIFQPAEEDGNGAEVMVREGVLDRFEIAEVYGIHNAPELPAGRIETAPGPIMAAVDAFRFEIRGRGGHAAFPHDTVDPIPAALALAQAMDTIVSRNRAPSEPLVVSVTQVHAGTAPNVVPERAVVGGTVRRFSEDMHDLCARRMRDIADGIGAAFRVTVDLDYRRDCPATVNHPEETAFAVDVARDVVSDSRVGTDRAAETGAEDFAFMLEARPGAYVFLGQGPGPRCHNPGYDFNDDIAPIGASYFARLVEMAQPPEHEDSHVTY